eukprot:4564417-Amphidinium_carterae.2
MGILGGWPKDTRKKEILAFVRDHLAADALSACTEYFCPGPRVSICLVKFPSKKALHSAIPLVKQKAHLNHLKREMRGHVSQVSAVRSNKADFDVVYKTGLIFLGNSRVAERKQDGTFRIIEDNLVKELSAPYGKCAANAMREAAAQL